jgi:hypothetical protein
MTANAIRFVSDFLAKFKAFSCNCSKILAWSDINGPIQNPSSHCWTTSQTHLNDVKWSGGDSFGFMTANAIMIGSDLLAKFEAFSQLQ